MADLYDAQGVLQGQPGCANRPVAPGDRLLAVDGAPAEHAHIGDVHRLLDGPAGSAVRITLGRGEAGEVFEVVAVRHAPFQPPTPRGAATAAAAAPPPPHLLGQAGSPGWVGAGGGIVVSPRAGEGTHRDLITAVADAAAGSTITVCEGAYAGPVYVSLAVTIQAAPGAAAVLATRDGRAALVVGGAGVAVVGLSLEQSGGDGGLRGRGAVRCVEVLQGSVRLADCGVRSERGIGVMVADGGRAELEGCALLGCGKCGALALDGGVLTVADCRVAGSGVYGLVCQSGGRMTVQRCLVSENAAVGVLVHRAGAECRVSESDVSHNGEMGLAVQDGGVLALEQVPPAPLTGRLGRWGGMGGGWGGLRARRARDSRRYCGRDSE